MVIEEECFVLFWWKKFLYRIVWILGGNCWLLIISILFVCNFIWLLLLILICLMMVWIYCFGWICFDEMLSKGCCGIGRFIGLNFKKLIVDLDIKDCWRFFLIIMLIVNFFFDVDKNEIVFLIFWRSFCWF